MVKSNELGWLARGSWIGNLGALALGCNVAAAPSSTGGVEFDEQGGSVASGGTHSAAGAVSVQGGATSVAGNSVTAGEGSTASSGAASTDPEPCDRGVVVVTSDYKSSNVAISKLDGTTLSASFVSSGATKPGLALAISGDVEVPFVAPASKRLVILDRYGTNVITWMDVSTASVLAQLPVGAGFESNPHDYVEIDDTLAYVTRFGVNLAPGAQAFDRGSDVLIVDTKTPAIVESIPIPEEDARLFPRPDSMNWIGAHVVVTLGRWSTDYATVGDGRLIGISPATHRIAWQVDLAGLKSCGRVAVSPTRKLAAVACSGKRDSSTKQYDVAASDIVILDITTTPPSELRRLRVPEQVNAGLQPAVTFAAATTLLAKSFGGNAAPGDHVLAVDVASGEVTDLGAATKPYMLGGIHCAPSCGDICLLSDAERSRLRRWNVSESGTLTPLDDLTVDTLIGLPPRSIGSL